MNLPRPGVTRTVKEMEAKGYLQKLTSPDDGRVTYISITGKKERGFPGSMIRIISAVWRPIFQRFPKKKQTI